MRTSTTVARRRAVCAFLIAVMALVSLLAFLASTPSQAAPLDDGTGDDPRISTINVTSTLPVSDTRPGDGVDKVVYFSDTMPGVITLTFGISGTPALTLTAGTAFGDPARVLTSPTTGWSPVVTYSVEAGSGSQPGIGYTVANTNGVSTTVVITYVRDVTGPTTAIGYPPPGCVTGTQVVVTGTAQDNDGGSGVRRVQVATDTAWADATGTASWAYTWDLPIADNVVYTISARAEDFLGTPGAAATRAVTVDTVAPTAAAPTDAGVWVATSTLVFTWTPSADGAGIAGYYVVITHSGGTVVNDEFVVSTEYVLTGAVDGVTYFARVKARDGNGNVGGYGPASDGVTPDLTPPDVQYEAPPILLVSSTGLYAVGPTVYYTNDTGSDLYFIVQGTATDTLSGEGTVAATPALGTPSPGNTGTWEDWAFTYRVPPGATASGQITVTASDGVGHTGFRLFTYTHDALPPTGTLTIQGGVTYVAAPTVTLALSASDNPTGCGVAQMCVADTPACSGWEPYTAARQWVLAGGDGEKVVYARFRDHLENTSVAVSDTVFLDTASPLVTVTAPAQTVGTTFTVSWEAADPVPGSGVVSYTVAYREDGGGWTIWLPSTTLTSATFLSATLEHTYVFNVTAYDRAGNFGEGSASTCVGLRHVYLPLVMDKWLLRYALDNYEPNDTPDQAYGPLDSGVTYEAYMWDATDRDDYYYFTPSTSTSVHVTLTNIPSGCDYDLYVYYYDGQYRQVAYSNRPGNANEGVTFTSVAGRKYYVRVYRYSGSSNQQPYRLKATY